MNIATLTLNTAHTVAVDEITIAKRKPTKGSKLIEYTVDVNGEPFALIWTNKPTKTCRDTWKVGFADDRRGLSGFTSYEDAETAMRGAI